MTSHVQGGVGCCVIQIEMHGVYWGCMLLYCRHLIENIDGCACTSLHTVLSFEACICACIGI